jgi:hypothetical protein
MDRKLVVATEGAMAQVLGRVRQYQEGAAHVTDATMGDFQNN